MIGAAGRAVYRLRQFTRALDERRMLVSADLVEADLNERGLALFRALSPRDQAHSARTAAVVRGGWPLDGELVTAALLHDVGKGRQQLWQRGAYVVLSAAAPALLVRLARAGVGWRGALYRSLRHAELGAQMAAGAGYGAGICKLIAEHHQPAGEPRQAALQAADEAV